MLSSTFILVFSLKLAEVPCVWLTSVQSIAKNPTLQPRHLEKSSAVVEVHFSHLGGGLPEYLEDCMITISRWQLSFLPSDPAERNTIPYIREELTGLPKSGDSQGNVGNQEVALASGQAGKGGSLQFLRAATSNWLEASKKRTKTTFAPWPWWDWPPCYWGSPQPGQRRQMSHWPQPFRLQLGILKLLRLY